jgi:hypothetical protein
MNIIGFYRTISNYIVQAMQYWETYSCTVRYDVKKNCGNYV